MIENYVWDKYRGVSTTSIGLFKEAAAYVNTIIYTTQADLVELSPMSSVIVMMSGVPMLVSSEIDSQESRPLVTFKKNNEVVAVLEMQNVD